MPRSEGARWYLWLVLVCVAGSALPVVWILTHDLHAVPTGDAFYFHYQAKYIADGRGWFINPYSGLPHQPLGPSAEHPPLWILVLAFADTIGITSYPAQLFFACAIGAGAVFCTGLAAREVGGRRVGLVAAVVAAVYPNYWINEFLGLSETLVLLLVALVILAAVRLWRRPGLAGAAGLGLLCGLAADTRAEQVLLLPLVLAPILLLHRALDWRRRIGYLALGGAAAVLVIAPWIGFNLSRFTHHVYFSTDEGQTLAMANCRPTYYGNFIGSDDFYCIDKIAVPRGDESVRNARYAKVAKAYMSEHTLRLPVVMLARVGREFAFYAPLGNIHQESVINDRPESLAWVGLGMYYVLLAGSIYGVVVLRRRGMTVVPYAGILLELVITAAVTFGETRYRAPFEVVLVVLGAVAADDLWSRWRSRTGSAPAAVVEDQRPSVLSVP